MSDTKFYITTPIYYPNGEPHLGHVYTTLARRHDRALSPPAPGTTRSSSPAPTSTASRWSRPPPTQGIEPRQLADRVVAVFESVWKELDITNDDFIRTTSRSAQVGRAEDRRASCVANGDIYLGGYEGWYDEGQEEFVTETEAKAARVQVRHQRPAAGALHGADLLLPAEEVRRRACSAHIEQHPDFIQPEARRNEVISKLEAGRRGPVDQPGDAEVGHPDAARSRATCCTSGSTR